MKYTPYSFSKIHTFFNCPKKFEFTYVNKIPVDREYSDPLYFRRGRFVHSYLATRLKGERVEKLGKYYADAKDKLHLVECAESALENEYVAMTFEFETTKVESYISLGVQLEPVKRKKDSAIGGYVDYYAVQDDYAMILDWKSGKYRKHPHYSQLELYAIWIIEKYPNISEIDLVFYYVEHKKIAMKTITSKDVSQFKEELVERIDTIENTEVFEINETKQCINCPFYKTCIENFGIKEL